jgi:hypothetical protein
MSSVTDNALSTLCLVPGEPPLAQLQASTGYAKIDVALPHRPDVDRPCGSGARYQHVKRLLIRAAHFELEIPHVRCLSSSHWCRMCLCPWCRGSS